MMITAWITSFYQSLNALGYRHPLHPALVHLPIGLVIGAFVFGWAAFFSKNERLARTARHCFGLAFIFWFPAVFFGLLDWQHFYGGAWLGPVKIKMVLAGILFSLFLVELLSGLREGGSPRLALAIYTLGLLTVVLLGFNGAQLVYGEKTVREAGTYQAGEKVFAANCRVCHLGGENVIQPDKPIRNSAKLKDFDTFIFWIRQPRAPMPPFPEAKVSVNQARELYSYITDVLLVRRDSLSGPTTLPPKPAGP